MWVVWLVWCGPCAEPLHRFRPATTLQRRGSVGSRDMSPWLAGTSSRSRHSGTITRFNDIRRLGQLMILFFRNVFLVSSLLPLLPDGHNVRILIRLANGFATEGGHNKTSPLAQILKSEGGDLFCNCFLDFFFWYRSWFSNTPPFPFLSSPLLPLLASPPQTSKNQKKNGRPAPRLNQWFWARQSHFGQGKALRLNWAPPCSKPLVLSKAAT